MSAGGSETWLDQWDHDDLQFSPDAHQRDEARGGCSGICESVVGNGVPIGDVMRYLMYRRDYGDRDYAVAKFDRIPENIRRRMADLDYSPAEKRCPQKMAIGRLMREAVEEFS
jgi:predicted aldo/keto reductase-like oxidoreductase